MAMRKMMILSIALLLCLSCSACAGQQGLYADITAYKNASTKIVLRLGMDRAEVDQLLGTGTFFDWDATLNEKNPERKTHSINKMRLQKGLEDYYYGSFENYIFITYQAGKVISLSVSIPYGEKHMDRSLWRDAFDLSFGASYEDIVNTCGEPSFFLDAMQVGEYSYARLTYYYNASGTLLESGEGASVIMEYYIDQESKTLISYSVASMIEQ